MAHLVVNRVTKKKNQPRARTQMQNRIRYALTTQTAHDFIKGGGFVGHPETIHDDESNGNGGSAALILGSDIWDILSNNAHDPFFDDHLAACAQVVELARTRYPNTTVMWK